jgi:hypothetical protein
MPRGLWMLGALSGPQGMLMSVFQTGFSSSDDYSLTPGYVGHFMYNRDHYKAPTQ